MSLRCWRVSSAPRSLTAGRKDKTLQGYDLHEKLAAIHSPALIIGGEYDMVPPIANERIHDQLRGSRYVLLKECGHFPYIKAAGKFFPLVADFLKDAGK